MQNLINCASKVQLLIVDVDGILSDGRIIYDSQGIEIKAFNVKDGLGLKSLQKYGIKTAIITGRTSTMVDKRAKEMGVDYVIQGRDDKLVALQEMLASTKFELADCAYIGDDLPDLKALQAVGFSATVHDAHKEVVKRVQMVTSRSGGEGAVREVCDLILKGHGVYDDYIDQYIL